MNSHEVFIHIHQGCFAGTGAIVRFHSASEVSPMDMDMGWIWIWENQSMYNHNKAQQSKNRVHISWDILYLCSDGYNYHSVAIVVQLAHRAGTLNISCTIHTNAYQSCFLWRIQIGNAVNRPLGWRHTSVMISQITDNWIVMNEWMNSWNIKAPHCWSFMERQWRVYSAHSWANNAGNVSMSRRHQTLAAMLLDIVHHYIDVIMTTMASQITSLTVVYSIVYSGAEKHQRKHQSYASLAFVRGICRDRWNPRTKG